MTETVSPVAEATFASLGLSPERLKVLDGMGFTTPTPIQARAIPLALAGQDIIGCAQTGTGKTAAFVLPMLERLKPGEAIVGLVLAPTRELALQIHTELQRLAGHHRPLSAVLIGGNSFGAQVGQLKRRPPVIIATPGRLVDHLDQQTIRLDGIHTLVLDEADRMLDMGFTEQLERILSHLKAERQTLLFSATLSRDVTKFAGKHLKAPQQVGVSVSGTTAAKVVQKALAVREDLKIPMIAKLLLGEPGKVLIFVRTRSRADKVAKRLQQLGEQVAVIHSDRSQAQRKTAMDAFRAEGARVLVATDIAARGIDVKDIMLVINADVPRNPEDYVHRIGRTGRASGSGVALTFVANDERKLWPAVERMVRQKLPPERVDENEPKLKALVEQLAGLPVPPASAPDRSQGNRWQKGPRRAPGAEVRKDYRAGASPRPFPGSPVSPGPRTFAESGGRREFTRNGEGAPRGRSEAPRGFDRPRADLGRPARPEGPRAAAGDDDPAQRGAPERARRDSVRGAQAPRAFAGPASSAPRGLERPPSKGFSRGAPVKRSFESGPGSSEASASRGFDKPRQDFRRDAPRSFEQGTAAGEASAPPRKDFRRDAPRSFEQGKGSSEASAPPRKDFRRDAQAPRSFEQGTASAEASAPPRKDFRRDAPRSFGQGTASGEASAPPRKDFRRDAPRSFGQGTASGEATAPPRKGFRRDAPRSFAQGPGSAEASAPPRSFETAPAPGEGSAPTGPEASGPRAPRGEQRRKDFRRGAQAPRAFAGGPSASAPRSVQAPRASAGRPASGEARPAFEGGAHAPRSSAAPAVGAPLAPRAAGPVWSLPPDVGAGPARAQEKRGDEASALRPSAAPRASSPTPAKGRERTWTETANRSSVWTKPGDGSKAKPGTKPFKKAFGDKGAFGAKKPFGAKKAFGKKPFGKKPFKG